MLGPVATKGAMPELLVFARAKIKNFCTKILGQSDQVLNRRKFRGISPTLVDSVAKVFLSRRSFRAVGAAIEY
jgi:hypothetical protein